MRCSAPHTPRYNELILRGHEGSFEVSINFESNYLILSHILKMNSYLNRQAKITFLSHKYASSCSNASTISCVLGERKTKVDKKTFLVRVQSQMKQKAWNCVVRVQCLHNTEFNLFFIAFVMLRTQFQATITPFSVILNFNVQCQLSNF